MSDFNSIDKNNLENWYQESDPWAYETTPDDANRLEHIRLVIPKLEFPNTLDIGCGNGFITRNLPGQHVYGVDISENAIEAARQKNPAEKFNFQAASIFDLPYLNLPPIDLLVVTGVLYDFYIGDTLKLCLTIIDDLLKPGGVLVSSHIHEWYKVRFPYLTVSREWFAYRHYYQILEVYAK